MPEPIVATIAPAPPPPAIAPPPPIDEAAIAEGEARTRKLHAAAYLKQKPSGFPDDAWLATISLDAEGNVIPAEQYTWHNGQRSWRKPEASP